jgi:archaeal type IV pilus assembly protein PilA
MDEPESWFEKGVTLFEHENYSGAINAFNRAISMNQFPVDAWCNRGLAYAQMGQYEQALESIDKALSLDPNHGNAIAARSVVLGLVQKTEKLGRAPEETSPPLDVPDQVPAPASDPEIIHPPDNEKIRNPLFAAIFSALFPGWGQWYDGRRWEGLLFFGAAVILGISTIVLSFLLHRNPLVSGIFTVMGFALWVYGMYHAYKTAERINAREIGFTNKSRLFWLPVLILGLMVALLIVSALLAFFVFGMAGSIHHEKVVAATAQQPDSNHIVVTYQGGPDASQLSLITVTVTDSSGKSQTNTLGAPDGSDLVKTGSSVTFTGLYSSKDHVVASAKFRDGSDQVILDVYL